MWISIDRCSERRGGGGDAPIVDYSAIWKTRLVFAAMVDGHVVIERDECFDDTRTDERRAESGERIGLKRTLRWNNRLDGSGTGIRTPVPWLRTTCPDP